MFRACRAWLITSECCRVSAAHMSSARSHQPALTCSKRWLHHLLRPRQARQRHFPPLFGHSSARLSSSFRRPASKQSKAKRWRAFTSSTHIILTSTNQFPIHHFFFHSRDTFLRLHSLHPAPIPATAILAYPTRTQLAAFQRV